MRQILRLASKDVLLELRAKEVLNASLLTALLVAVVGALAYHGVGDRAAVTAGVAWTGLTFAASLGLARALTAERDRGTLDALLALPVWRGQLYLGKLLSALAVMLVVALVALPAYALLAGGAWSAAEAGRVAVIVLLGVAGLAGAGTALAGVAANTRAREMMLPVLLLPVVAPVLIAAIAATARVLSGETLTDVRGQLSLLFGYDLAMIAAATLLFEFAVEG